jgi:hypothetical protein
MVASNATSMSWIDTFAGAERVEQLGQDELRKGHRRFPSARTWRYTQSRRWPTCEGCHQLPQNPITQRAAPENPLDMDACRGFVERCRTGGVHARTVA